MFHVEYDAEHKTNRQRFVRHDDGCQIGWSNGNGKIFNKITLLLSPRVFTTMNECMHPWLL